MLIRFKDSEEEKALRNSVAGARFLWAPEWYVQNVVRARQLVARMVHEERLRTDPSYADWYRWKTRDTKPDIVVDNSDPDRPIMVVGAGTAYREDLLDLAKRVKEKPNPAKNPKHRERHNVLNDIDRLAETGKRRKTGTATFHIRNNPLVKE